MVLFTFFNRDPAQIKNNHAYVEQWANENVWVWSIKHNAKMNINQKIVLGWGPT